MPEFRLEGNQSTARHSRRRRFTRLASAAVFAGLTLVAPNRSDAAERPSFDCAKAATATERTICRSDALALLDRDIAELYRQRRARAPSAQSFDTNQRQWLSVRDACADDVACLKKEMAERKQHLQELFARFAKAPAKDKSGFTGAYSNTYGTAEIEAVSATEFDVSISTEEPKEGRWQCDFSATGHLKGAAIVIPYRGEVDDTTVVVTLTRKPGVVTVREDRTDQASYCGHNGYIEGTYRQRQTPSSSHATPAK
jgi:uncharacterized protein